MRRTSAVVVFVALVSLARADWTVREDRSEFSRDHASEHRHLLLTASDGETATLELAIFSPKHATLRVLDNPEGADDLASAMRHENCLAGVNGGYFDPAHAPVGLSISDRQVLAPLSKARLLSGVVSASNGRVQIDRAAEFSVKSKPDNARQCGPFLVDRAQAIAGLNATRAARRTFVATSAGDERAMLGYCSPVTLAQLADLLLTPALKIRRALNLDGGSSSAFWFAGEDGVFSIGEQKTVRDFVAIVPKPPRP